MLRKLSEKEHIEALEQSYRDALKKRYGYFYYPGGMFHGGWQPEKCKAIFAAYTIS